MMTYRIRLLFVFFLISSFLIFKYISPALNKPKINLDKIKFEITTYPMQDIIKRCQKDFGYSEQDMIILEQELKRFLILATVDHSSIGMYSQHVDNLWHTFILFTKKYKQFCNKFAGKFIHHVPTTDDDKKNKNPAQAHSEFENFIKLYEKTFNEKAHDIWFLDACEKNNIL